MPWHRPLAALVAALASAMLVPTLTAPSALATPRLAAGPADCGTSTTAVGAIQGTGAATPMPGATVVVEGVVVGDFQSGGFRGYYVQDAGDGLPETSDGIFVYDRAGVAVSLGDVVRVQGAVSEYEDLTEITATSATICGTDELPEPVALELPVTGVQYEAHEGMRVVLPQSLSIIEYFNYGRYGEITLAPERQHQPTAVFAPGSTEAVALAERNATARITLDDGRSAQNPNPAIHPNGEEFNLTNSFRGGDLVTGTTGVLDQRFGLWRLQPTQGAEFTRTNERPSVPDVGGDLRVASFNVLNYFTTLGDRGADTAEEFQRQEAKIVAAINELDAQIVGLLEIENNDGLALRTLVAALNEAAGTQKWAAVDTGTIGTDAITTALIYQPGRVHPVGSFATLDETVDPRFDSTKNRPALAQTFGVRGSATRLTLAVNHLKSKGSSCEDVGDPEDPNGQGNCNRTRTEAAQALADWLAADPTGTHAPLQLIMGDLNAYDHEDPITTLTGSGFTDLIKKFGGEFAYSYVFDGQLGYLDHGLANARLTQQVTGAAEWHVNSDETSLIDYDMTFKQDAQDALYAPNAFRSSDHDAVVIGIATGHRGRR